MRAVRADEAEDPQLTAGPGRDRVPDHLHVGGDGLRRARLRRIQHPALGVEVEEVDHQLGTRDAVDGAVVHLGDDTDVAVGQALHDVELPERAAPVERGAGDLRGHLGQLPMPAGARGSDATDVVVEVEVRILDPDRVVQAERHRHDAAPERRHQVQPRLDEVLDRLEVVAALHRRRIEDRGHGDVHVHARRLEVQKGRVKARKSLHGVRLGEQVDFTCSGDGTLEPMRERSERTMSQLLCPARSADSSLRAARRAHQ